MTSSHSSRSHRLPQALFAVFMALALCVALTGTAGAAPGKGEVTLTLKKQGLKASYTAKAGKTGSAKRPKGKKGAVARTVVLPVSSLEVGAAASVVTEGGLTLSAGGRRATLGDLTVRALEKGTAVSARLGDKTLVFFRSKTKPAVDTLTVKLSAAKLSLTGKGARALRDRLGLGSLSGGPLGSLSVDAAVTPEPAKSVPPTGGGEEPKPEPGAPYPYEAQCPVGNVEGGPGFGSAPTAVGGIAAAPVFSPTLSQPLTGTSVEWGFKDSFRNYVLTFGPEGSLQVLDGATANPAGPTMAAAGSFFGFPMTTGTYEAGGGPGHAGDKLIAEGTGTVLLCKPGHGFNIVIRNPTVTLDGDNSRITADVGVNAKGTWYPFQRADIADLDLDAATPQITAGGSAIAWEDIPVTMSADGVAATGGLYPAGTALDKITVVTTLGERPLLTQCAIDEGTASTLPNVDFTLADLPALNSPVTRSGSDLGTINWGFRRATRSTAQNAGHFDLLGGATASHPGAMGGGSSMNPGPGLGKYFRFPISSYQYEADAGPGPDRLIATSDATVGFCTLNQGTFAVAISKPTLIVDGGDSRIVANAYSFTGPDGGWIGGRVDLVDLDPSAVEPVATGETVTWGDVTPDNVALTKGIPVDGGLQTEALSLTGLTQGSGTGAFDPVAAQIKLAPQPYPYQAECPVPSTDPPGAGPGQVAGTTPLPAFNAGTSQPVTGTSIEWGFKASLRDYVLNVGGPGGSLQAFGTATANPVGGNMSAADSYFGFPVGSGTYEPGSAPANAEDKLVANGAGTMLFCKAPHGFAIAFKNPTAVIDGASSRIVADVAVNQDGVWHPYQRADIATLNLTGVQPVSSDAGQTLVWEDVPATLTADGRTAASLGGFYAIGEALDTVTVRTKVERPLLTGCPIAQGTTIPAGVTLTQTAPPALNSPVAGTGGTIDWGFRRATRNSAATSGKWQMLGGATEGYPDNMGGGEAPPPSGGQSKFFRFPISKWAYEAGAPGDGSDDRLVATSEASVGICNSNAMTGNFAVFISKPTLIVNGSSSRIVANAYGFRGPNFGWSGGRVDLINFNATGVAAVSGAGTVSWGDIPADNTPLVNGIPASGGLLTNALAVASLPAAANGGATTGWDPVSVRIQNVP